jgi:predicted dithiol-disulfide oxidoreductase (DUF899 family)
MSSNNSALPDVVSQKEWRQSLKQLLHEEKLLTKARDRLSALRRTMPMTKVEKDYQLIGPAGNVSLHDLFAGRNQLLVYHFMFAPDWQEGCPGCSWVRDAMTHPAHLRARDTNLVMVSRAPLKALIDYQARMQWSTPIPWYSSLGSEFNYDFDATSDSGEEHGVSVFLRDGKDIYRSYYVGARGVEYLGTQWSYLDLTPYGRQETWEDSPAAWPQTPAYSWGRRHDDYE